MTLIKTEHVWQSRLMSDVWIFILRYDQFRTILSTCDFDHVQVKSYQIEKVEEPVQIPVNRDLTTAINEALETSINQKTGSSFVINNLRNFHHLVETDELLFISYDA